MRKKILTILGIVAVFAACELPSYPANGPGCKPIPPEPNDYVPNNPQGWPSGTWYYNGQYYGWSRYEDSCINP